MIDPLLVYASLFMFDHLEYYELLIKQVYSVQMSVEEGWG